jgi:hypothetical protein
MRRVLSCLALLLCAAAAAPGLRADVKTTEKSTFKLEGMMGAMLNRLAGGSDGITSTVAVKGTRMSRMTNTNGQIIDLAEEKVYNVDVRRKEYTVVTFAQMREQMEKMKTDMSKQQQKMSTEDKQALADAGKELEFDVDVSQTGQTKAIAGQNTREVVLTITMRQRGRTLEEGGGLVTTNTMWMAPRVAALDELNAFNMKYFKAVYGGLFAGFNPQQMGAMSAMMPGMSTLMERMAAESRKLDGSALSTNTVIESVKSAEQMANAPKPTGGGIGGMLARRMSRGSTEQRTRTMTTTHDYVSIAAAASDADVAIPAGFREKK